MESIKLAAASRAAIDAKFPSPEIAIDGATLYRVAKVEGDGRLVLDKGLILKLDGIGCSTDGIGYISRLLTNPTARIAFSASSKDLTQPIPADVWLVDISSLQSGQTTPSYSMLAETALTSGWCVPERSTTSTTSTKYGRYVALADWASRSRR
jgi:hypothetical protein